MPAETRVKSERATWLDWLPSGTPEPEPEDLLTREEIATKLAAMGVAASPEDLRYWEAQGFLPRGVRRRHAGATRSVYPPWFVFLVFALREFQREGISLERAARRLRRTWERATSSGNLDHIGDMIAADIVFRALESLWRRQEAITGKEVAKIHAIAMVFYVDQPLPDYIKLDMPALESDQDD